MFAVFLERPIGWVPEAHDAPAEGTLHVVKLLKVEETCLGQLSGVNEEQRPVGEGLASHRLVHQVRHRVEATLATQLDWREKRCCVNAGLEGLITDAFTHQQHTTTLSRRGTV